MELCISYKRGDLVWAFNKTSPSCKHVQKGDRPFVILQNDTGNYASSTLVVAPVTTKTKKHNQPTHAIFDEKPFEKPSCVQLEQIKTIDKQDVFKYMGRLSVSQMEIVDVALSNSIGIKYNDLVATKEAVKAMTHNTLLHTLAGVDKNTLVDVIEELQVMPTKIIKETIVETNQSPIINNLEFGELQPLSIALQGNLANYKIDKDIVITLKGGKVAEKHLHILIKELEMLEKITKKQQGRV